MRSSEKRRGAVGTVAHDGRRPPWEEELLMTRAVGSLLSRSVAEERATYAILAAMKPDDTNDAVLRTAQWLAEREHRELHAISVVETAPIISAFAAGVPVEPPFHDEERRRAIKREMRSAYERS